MDRFRQILEVESAGLSNGLQESGESGESRVTLGFWLSHRGNNTMGCPSGAGVRGRARDSTGGGGLGECVLGEKEERRVDPWASNM